ncbi:hypothetical protein OZ411_06640 [Bradyrhizobium sp. Arg237L]|uniref:hypothetical protein n=1 Tax=Bradyrhizobium sp. Arg237L TaxID=3003352 RepID=UPI00249DF813|nr:hypothetical protein [Bradyrhizobium sp. Arg237L]MDI4232490.1 hypothetical protein [Bradyrhizobium sp. Arg237L]
MAANETGLVAGHLMIGASDDETTSGRFVIVDEYLPRLGVDQCAFISAAGALAELCFCDLTNPARLGPDIAAFRTVLTRIDPRLTNAGLIGLWQDRYETRFAALADALDMNFEICHRLCERGEFLLDGVHVIPSHVLVPAVPRERHALDAEIVQTAPLSVRQKVRQDFDRLRYLA